jgi:hypothetical protein
MVRALRARTTTFDRFGRLPSAVSVSGRRRLGSEIDILLQRVAGILQQHRRRLQ